MSVILQPGELTNGEKLFLDRRRSGNTRVQAAKKWKVSKNEYIIWEKNDSESIPFVKMNDVTSIEMCVIQRKRWKITQDHLAKELNLSRSWVNQMEKGSSEPARLIFYWRRLDGQRPLIANV